MGWKQHNSRRIVANQWITLDEAEFELPNGKRLPSYWLVTKPDYIVVAARTAEGFVLIREWRPGSGAVHTGFPAGFIDAGESAIGAAVREFREETGHELQDPRIVGTLEPQPGWLNCRCTVVTGRAIAPPQAPELDAEIEAVWIRPPEAVERMVRSGEITEMHSVAALYLALGHPFAGERAD